MVADNIELFRTSYAVSHKRSFTSAAAGNLADLECYLASGGNINGRDEDGLALIHYAACHGDVLLIRRLSEHGADMNLLDGGAPAWKPIHYAIYHRKHEAEEILRTFGAEMPLPILKRIASEKPRVRQSEKESWVLAGRM